MIPHFGVECEHCQEAVLTPIHREWADLEPAIIQLYLCKGLGLEPADDNTAISEEIHVFFEEHGPHGARPCVCELEEADA